MVREAVGFVVVLGQFAEIAMNVVGVAAVGFELNGHVFDAEVGRNSVLDQLQQFRRGMMRVDHDVAREHNQPGLDRPDV